VRQDRGDLQADEMNTAAITAATICAASRVRFGPMTRNIATRQRDR